MQTPSEAELAVKGLEEAYARILLDAAIPGAAVSVDPVTAVDMGAFAEDALDFEDAVPAVLDNLIGGE
jgi:hypothetical protein